MVCFGNKKQSSSNQKGIVPENRKKAYLVAEEVSKKGEGYAFTIGGGLRGGEITLKVGGIVLYNVLIDSGASCNLIDYDTWNNIKQNRIECESIVSDKKLFAYEQKESLEVVGTIVAEVVCEDNGAECVEEFTVIKGTGRTLLGRKTAMKYQRIISDVIRGWKGVANIADDLIVHGRDTGGHDKNLSAVLERLRERGLTLNGAKCQFTLHKLTFFRMT